MFCVKCGQQLPSDANFCYKCGKPTPLGEIGHQEQRQQWDYCIIVMKSNRLWEKQPSYWFGGRAEYKDEYWWEAEAIGPNGKYIAASSPKVEVFEYSDRDGLNIDGPARQKHQNLRDELYIQLLRDGWEDYQGRLRRLTR